MRVHAATYIHLAARSRIYEGASARAPIPSFLPRSRLFLVSQLVTNEPTNYRGCLHEPRTRDRARRKRAEGKTKEERQHEISDAPVTQASFVLSLPFPLELSLSLSLPLSPLLFFRLFLSPSPTLRLLHTTILSLSLGSSWALPGLSLGHRTTFPFKPLTRGDTRPCPSRIPASRRASSLTLSLFLFGSFSFFFLFPSFLFLSRHLPRPSLHHLCHAWDK